MQWQPIETAPKGDEYGTEYLLWIPGLGVRPAFRGIGRSDVWFSPVDEDREYNGATHWMPLPEPPK